MTRVQRDKIEYDDDVNKTFTFEPLNRSIENIEQGKTSVSTTEKPQCVETCQCDIALTF